MAFNKSEDWIEKLKSYCPCFNNSLKESPPEITCPKNQEICPAYLLKCLLLAPENPSKTIFTKALLMLSLYTRKEIIQALQHVFKITSNSAASKIVYTLNRLKRDKFKIQKDDRGRYVITV